MEIVRSLGMHNQKGVSETARPCQDAETRGFPGETKRELGLRINPFQIPRWMDDPQNHELTCYRIVNDQESGHADDA